MKEILKLSDYIRWALRIILLVWMFMGNTIILYISVALLVINQEIEIIGRRMDSKIDNLTGDILEKLVEKYNET